MSVADPPFDVIEQAWSELLAGDPDPPEWGPHDVTVGGRGDGHLPSNLRVEDAATACVGVALLAACALAGTAPRRPSRGRDRAGVDPSSPVQLDRGHLADAVRSERFFRVEGRSAGPGFAPLSRFWPVADGWVRTHANFPWHRDALLAALESGPDPSDVAAAVAGRRAEDVEQLVVGAGGVAAAVRSRRDWMSHPQGAAVAAEPLVSHEALGDTDPRHRHPASAAPPARPATGVRVLDLTRVIAGPVATRYLGALGAEVLRVDRPDRPDLPPGEPADTLVAKRSSALDLREPYHLAALHELLEHADAVVCGYRPGALDRFGLAAADLAERHPGLVVVYVSAWGHSGPWHARRGFDSVVQAPTGVALAESRDGAEPGALPCQLLDHGTGYLAAAAVLDGLRRQRAGGATHVRRLSLARTAAWLLSCGTRRPGTAAGSERRPPRSRPPASVDRPSASTDRAGSADHPGRGDVDSHQDRPGWLAAFGGPPPVELVAPPGSLLGRPLRWPGPPSSYLADAPAWST